MIIFRYSILTRLDFTGLPHKYYTRYHPIQEYSFHRQMYSRMMSKIRNNSIWSMYSSIARASTEFNKDIKKF